MLEHEKIKIKDFVNWLYAKHGICGIDEGYLDKMIEEYENDRSGSIQPIHN